jgi:hypothetical protein
MPGALTFSTSSLRHFQYARIHVNSAFAAPDVSRGTADYLLNFREAARVALIFFKYSSDVLHCRYGGVIANEQFPVTSSSKRTQLLWS